MAEKFKRATLSRNFLKTITRKKSPDEMVAEAGAEGLEKTLGVWDLIILGVGAIIGSGIFAVVGICAAGSADGSILGAGPALVICVMLFRIRNNDTGCRRSLHIYFRNIRRICRLDGRMGFNA